MTMIRIFHNDSGKILSREHRSDEHVLGSESYTEENVTAAQKGKAWFVCDITDIFEGDDELSWDVASVTNPGLAKELRAIDRG